MRSDDTYTPTEGCSAEELLKCLTADDYDACVAACSEENPEEEVIGNGLVTISKVSAAATQEVASNASKKNVGTIKLTAGDEGAIVSSLVVKRTGLGTYNRVSISFSNDAGTITTATKAFNSNNEATVRFSPALQLKANESVKLNALVTLNSANEEHSFTVTSANLANGKSEGTAALGTIRTTSYTVGTVDTTLVSLYPTPGTTDVKAGETKTILRVGLTPKRVSSINGFTLSKGNAGEDFDKAFSEVKAYVNNKEVGDVTMTSDKIIVKNLKLDKESGETANIELKASVKYIGAPASATFVFDSTADIDVVETNTNEAMQITLATAPAQVAVGLKNVDLTVTKTSTGTVTVVPGTSNITLYSAKVESSSNFDVTSYSLTMTPTVWGYGLNEFTSEKITLNVAGNPIEIDGTTAVTATAPTCTTTKAAWDTTDNTTLIAANCTAGYVPGTYVWSFGSKDSFPVEVKNAAKINVKAGTKTIANAVDYTFTFAIAGVQDQDNTSNKINITPALSENGDVVSVSAGALDIKNATVAAPAGRNLWANDSNLEAGRFAIKATAENISINKIVFTQDVTLAKKYVGNLSDVISSAKLVNVENDAVIATNGKVDNATQTITFDGSSILAEKDEDLNVKLVINTNSFALPTATANELKFNVSVAPADTNKETSGGPVAGAKLTNTATLINYVLNVKSPEITLVKVNDSVFKVTVKNVDTNNSLTLDGVDVRVRPVAENNSYSGSYCLRQEGSNDTDCKTFNTNTFATWSAATLGLIPGKTTDFTFATPQVISKNSSYTFEIYVDSNYVNPTTLMAEFTKAKFNTTSEESYSISIQ